MFCRGMQPTTATLVAIVAFCLLQLSQCTNTDYGSVGLAPADRDSSWLSEQGDCGHFFTSRRFITPQEAAVISTWTSRNANSSNNSSSSQQPGRRTPAGGDQGSGSTLDAGSAWCPALLWTYTGTGNTMTRLLIEAASGYHTGSVYTDLSLVEILPGEYVCDSSVLAVKAHPQWHSFASLSPEGFRPDTPQVPPDAKPICPCAYNRAVAVIRDPYATFLAEYKRLRTHDYDSCSQGGSDSVHTQQPCRGGHVSVIPKAEFNATDFRAEVLRMAQEWADMFESYDAFAAAHPGGLYLTTFEELTDPSRRVQALADLLDVLGVPPHVQDGAQEGRTALEGTHTCGSSMSDNGSAAAGGTCAAADGAAAAVAGVLQHDAEGCSSRHTPAACAASDGGAAAVAAAESTLKGYDAGRLQCAFQLARHPSIYRPKDPEGIDAAYVYGGDEELVCAVWRLVGGRAAAHGYRPYGAAQC